MIKRSAEDLAFMKMVSEWLWSSQIEERKESLDEVHNLRGKKESPYEVLGDSIIIDVIVN